MDLKLLFIPLALIIIGVVVMVFLNKKGARSSGAAQDVMRAYVIEQIPNMQNTAFDVVNLLDDAMNAQHIWVVAYNKDGLFLIPSLSNPLKQTIKRYEDAGPAFDLKRELTAALFPADVSESIDYVPFSAISGAAVQQDKKKIQISIGSTAKDFRYQSKDCFGADQEDTLRGFFAYLNSI